MSTPASASIPAARLGGLRRLLLQLPRDKADTLLLLGAALLVLAPHAGHLPLWVGALCAATLLWRAAITLRGTRMPPMLVLAAIALAAMGGVFLTYRTLFGRDAGVAMLVLLVAFKMLEMRARRDLFVVIFLCFFLVLTNFFYSQTIATGLLMVASVILLLTAQLSFQYTGAVPPLRRRLLLGARIFGMAAPLAVLLFFVFPRINGPLWGMPGDAGSGQGRSGLSRSMAPGNISNLAQSEELAFRVKFQDPVPRQDQLYWRGMVLGQFDGRTWTQPLLQARLGRAPALGGAPASQLRYQVTLEPHGGHWLFTLDLPRSAPEIDDNRSLLSVNYELSAIKPIGRRLRYDAVSQLDYRLQADHLYDRQPWLTLPAGFNPRALQDGLVLRRLDDPIARVRAVLDRFGRAPFSYTLEPPKLGRDTVDEFLFDTRAGFCEHYASAFVFLMRAADVPARVVLGYQGGEMNPVDGFLTVRQSEAHAWAEVWLAGRGWVRVDPTAAVAPERVQRSLGSALPPEPLFGMQGVGNLVKFATGEDSWLAQVRFGLSAVNNGWNQWVLDYTPERQRGVLDNLSDWLGNASALAGLLAIAALLVLARALRLRARADPVDALYFALCQRMGQLGTTRAGAEGPTAYARRISAGPLAQEKKAAAARFLQLYSAHKYGPAPADPGLASTLKSLLKQI